MSPDRPRPSQPPAKDRRTGINYNPQAVLLKSTGENLTFAQVISKAKEKESIKNLGIERAKIRKTATRAVLVEVYGKDTKEKADRLAERLNRELGEEIRVSRPSRRREVLLRGFDESVTPGEIKAALMDAGGGREADYEVRNIRPFGDGKAMVVIVCPIDLARIIEGRRKLMIGWSEARV